MPLPKSKEDTIDPKLGFATYYSLLGLPSFASERDVHNACIELVKEDNVKEASNLWRNSGNIRVLKLDSNQIATVGEVAHHQYAALVTLVSRIMFTGIRQKYDSALQQEISKAQEAQLEKLLPTKPAEPGSNPSFRQQNIAKVEAPEDDGPMGPVERSSSNVLSNNKENLEPSAVSMRPKLPSGSVNSIKNVSPTPKNVESSIVKMEPNSPSGSADGIKNVPLTPDNVGPPTVAMQPKLPFVSADRIKNASSMPDASKATIVGEPMTYYDIVNAATDASPLGLHLAWRNFAKAKDWLEDMSCTVLELYGSTVKPLDYENVPKGILRVHAFAALADSVQRSLYDDALIKKGHSIEKWVGSPASQVPSMANGVNQAVPSMVSPAPMQTFYGPQIPLEARITPRNDAPPSSQLNQPPKPQIPLEARITPRNDAPPSGQSYQRERFALRGSIPSGIDSSSPDPSSGANESPMTYYDILGLPKDASTEKIKSVGLKARQGEMPAAERRFTKLLDRDSSGAVLVRKDHGERFDNLVQRACDVLSKKGTRVVYDFAMSSQGL
ncbi:MAG: hypothetical protein M1820_002940 [Bogoriella megaspora]|nr:MAG: hypothetical protein M1820_002940 [Bogoriella megaspora]